MKITCLHGNGACDGSPKPKPLRRSCHPMVAPTRGSEYCKQCQSSQEDLERSQGLKTCSRCLDGFSISSGQCVNRRSFTKVGFHVNTAGRLFEHSDISVALPLAFEQTMQEVLGVAAQVISLASIIDEATASGKTLVTAVMTNSQSTEDWSNAESPLEGTAFLTQSQVRLKTLNTNKFRQNIATVLTKKLNTSLNGSFPAFPIWVESAFESEGYCPHLRRWRGPDQGCSASTEIPLPASPVEAVLPAPADEPREKKSDHDRHHRAGDRNDVLPSPASPVGDSKVDAANGSPIGDGKQLARANGSPVGDSKDAGANGRLVDGANGPSQSVVTGASLGAASATVLVFIVSVWRWRRRSASEAAEKAQLFKGLAGTSSW